MKIAKKFMTLALAAALGVGCATVGVGAAPINTSDLAAVAPSNTSDLASVAPINTSDLAAVAPSKTSEITVDSEHSSIYEVVKEFEKTQDFADLQAKYKDLADAFKKINDGTMKMEDFIKVLKSLSVDEADKADLEDAIAKLEGKMIVTFVYEFNVLKPEEAKPNDDGRYEVKINVPSLTDTMEGIQLWVYSKDGTKKFVVIDPVNIDKEGKTLTVTLNDGDFFMVIADAKSSDLAAVAPSRTSEITVDSEHSSIYEVVKEFEKTQDFADLQAKYKDLADAFKKINDGTMKMEDFIKVLKSLSVDEADKADLEDAIAKLEGKMIVTFVYEFNVLKPEEAKPNDDGRYEVKINVPSLTDTMEGIQLWVYSKDGTKKFVVIDPVNIDKEGKTLTVTLNDGDFFMVIADAK